MTAGLDVRDEQHVGLVDFLESAQARAVEAAAVGEQVFVERLRRDREVVPAAEEVGHAQIDARDVVLLYQFA